MFESDVMNRYSSKIHNDIEIRISYVYTYLDICNSWCVRNSSWRINDGSMVSLPISRRHTVSTRPSEWHIEFSDPSPKDYHLTDDLNDYLVNIAIIGCLDDSLWVIALWLGILKVEIPQNWRRSSDMDKDIVCSRSTFALQEEPQGCTNLGTSSPRGR